jgi:hypothetical protein
MANFAACCQEMARIQDFTPFIPGHPGAFSGPPAVGHLASEVAGELCTPDGPLIGP